MKFLFDLFPVALFFGVFRVAKMFEQAAYAFVTTYMGVFISGGAIKPDQAPIMLATAVVIVATVAQIAYVKLRGREVDGMLWLSFIIVTIFGGATIYFHNPDFILWKPTILYWVFALAMAISQFGLKKNMMRQTMEEQIKLPELVWHRVGLAWILFFTALGFINLLAAFVVFKGNDSAWVNFKLFGITGIMFAFIVAQTLYLSKYIEEEEKA